MSDIKLSLNFLEVTLLVESFVILLIFFRFGAFAL